MSISVILPSYKEAENLKLLLPLLEKSLSELNVNYEVLIVDTVSPTDDTRYICNEYSFIRYIKRECGDSYGDAVRTGIKYASMNYIVFMDADGSHDSSKISELYNDITSGYDLVICSRYIDGGNSHNGRILKFMSFMVNFCYRIIFNLKVRDVSNSFRIYYSSMLKSIKLECDNFDIVEEILIKLCLVFPEIKIKEIPIYFNKRLYGKSKRSLIKFIFSYIYTIARLNIIKIRYMKNQ